MTKQVRIENADSGISFKVKVFVEDKQPDGTWVRKEAESKDLNNPFQLVEAYLTNTRRLVIEEV